MCVYMFDMGIHNGIILNQQPPLTGKHWSLNITFVTHKRISGSNNSFIFTHNEIGLLWNLSLNIFHSKEINCGVYNNIECPFLCNLTGASPGWRISRVFLWVSCSCREAANHGAWWHGSWGSDARTPGADRWWLCSADQCSVTGAEHQRQTHWSERGGSVNNGIIM